MKGKSSSFWRNKKAIEEKAFPNQKEIKLSCGLFVINKERMIRV